MKQQEFDKQLIKAIPIGELQESIKNFQRISPIDHKAAHIQQALQVYSEEHLVLYESLQKQSLFFYCFMKQNRYKDGYFDQLRAKFVKVDFQNGKTLEQKAEQKSENMLKQNHLKFLIQLNDKLYSYLKKYYQGPYGAACTRILIQVHIQTKNDKIAQIKIQFTSKNISLYNFYTGQWLSKWTFTADNKYTSTIEIKNHFFEGGNILLQRKKKFEGNIENLDNPQKIVTQIQKCQSSYHTQLTRIYQDISTKGLKNLRKVTSFTQSKMNWNVNSVLLSRNLIQQSQKFQTIQKTQI